MLSNPEVIERFKEVRDQIEELLQVHENADHGGEPCVGNRCSTIAYLMHAMGLRAHHWRHIRWMLDDYNRRCPNACKHDENGGVP